MDLGNLVKATKDNQINRIKGVTASAKTLRARAVEVVEATCNCGSVQKIVLPCTHVPTCQRCGKPMWDHAAALKRKRTGRR